MKDTVKEFLALRGALLTERKQLLERLAQIEAALADGGATRSPGGTPGPRGRRPATERSPAAPVKRAKAKGVRGRPAKRVRNKTSLRDMALKVTRGNPMTKEQIIEAVVQAGYVFNAADPMPSLNSVLYSRNQFKNQDGRFSPAK
ncbi:MAG: hypothetical protein KDM81_02640 [Verrucomicrobiae bacterium]|nr:hypothetical protein [Verrucomicrobiae bacterium]MCP5521962.1 hypothetical protein [Verrucomicrobiales bacterium]